HARLSKNHSINSSPRTPNGLSMSWWGPAPKPSMDIAKLDTRVLGMTATNSIVHVQAQPFGPILAPDGHRHRRRRERQGTDAPRHRGLADGRLDHRADGGHAARALRTPTVWPRRNPAIPRHCRTDIRDRRDPRPGRRDGGLARIRGGAAVAGRR